MKYKLKLTLNTLFVGLLTLSGCNDKKKFVEIVKESPEVPVSAEEPKLEKSELNINSEKNPLARGEDGIVIGTLDPDKPGFMINPFTLETLDIRGIPGGTLIRDPNDPNPEHKLRVPHATK